jgi:hypothetical protein
MFLTMHGIKIYICFIILFSVFLTFGNCRNFDDSLDSGVFSGLLGGEELIRDQGYVKFDSLGNIMVEFNNTHFKRNPLFTGASYIGVFVFQRGSDVNLNCCTGNATVCGSASRACLRGVGFSQDLGFLGNRYIFREPPQAFNTNADKYYMDVKVSDNSGVPRDYQGDYTPFSGPTNPVGDRELYDLYVGIYYNLFGESGRLRPINVEAEIGTQTYFTRVAPDILSPKIEIESRFFAQTREDTPGNWYRIPSIVQWRQPPPLDTELDKRGRIRINEIGNAVDSVTQNDFIEIYNPTDLEISLDDVFIQRYTSNACSTLTSATQKEDLTGLSIAPRGFITLARNGNSLPNIDRNFKSSGGITISNDDCIALTKGTARIQSPNDIRVIDFVGMVDSESQNQFRGTPALQLVDTAAISRCPDGADSRNNGNDFFIESHTPGRSNNCQFIKSVSDANPGEILITEVLHSPTDNLGFEGGFSLPNCNNPDDNFVEIYNASNTPYNMANARVVYVSSTGSVSSFFFALPAFVLNPGEYASMISLNNGCYTQTSLSSRKAYFRSTSFGLAGNNASVILINSASNIPSQATNTSNDPIVPENVKVLDYVGWGTTPRIFRNSPAPRCDGVSGSPRTALRRKGIQNTNNNGNDFECGTVNGTPGRGE